MGSQFGVEQAACGIFGRVDQRLTYAELDYETLHGLHFIIDDGGARLRK